ncbi:Crp/Fnr family transcriptional regulator [Niabella sp. 22666]|uniref:Crp/Fnr family transcriptional regulator n=1 Tax=Niabella sp. 22666 TaxID=3453954 RepID=UPI003F86C06D
MSQLLFDYLNQYMELTNEEQQFITALDLFQQFSKNDILLKEGQYTSSGYFVLKGCIRCYYLVDGEEKTTAFYTELESLEPSCVISKKPSPYYVACVEDSIILVSNDAIQKNSFEKFPRFESLCRIFSERQLAKNQSSFDHFKTSSPEERYLHLQNTRPDLTQRVPQYQLASYLGITPQSLSRLRSRIAGKG